MKFTDSEKLDFLEKWDTSSHKYTWYSLLTQHVSKIDYPTLRDFCEYAIEFEKMIDSNNFDIISWHNIPLHLQEIVITVWENEMRSLTSDEKISLQVESDKYWEELYKFEEDSKDK